MTAVVGLPSAGRVRWPVIAVVAGVVVAAGGLAVAHLDGHTGHGSAAARRTGGVLAVDMSHATPVSCVSTNPTAPTPVLSQLFRVSTGAGAAYLLGWEIVPYHGPGTYAVAPAGNVFALEPAAGGRPVGYGTGTVTFSGSSTVGTVDVQVAMKAGGTLPVTGAWSCPAA